MARDVQHARNVLAATLRLMRLGTLDGSMVAAPFDEQVSMLDIVACARDHLVLWPVGQGLLSSSAAASGEPAVAQVLAGILATIDEQANRTSQQLAELSAALTAGGISPLFLKGSTFILENQLKLQPWRPMCDLDFLVDRGDLDRTVEIARTLGYESRTNRFSETHDVHFPMLLRPPDVVGLEPHVKLGWTQLPDALSVAAFQDQARTVDLAMEGGQATARIPSDMHRLAHLVVHAQISSHHYHRNLMLLRDLLDWFHLAGRDDIDMAELDHIFSSSGYQAHFRAYAAFCEQFWYPDQQRFKTMTWLHDYQGWSEKVVEVLVDPRLESRAMLHDWGRMAGAAIRSPREAARMIRSLAEPRRGKQLANLVRGLFR